MNCPFCHQRDTKVVDSRLMPDTHTIKRRRKCEHCLKRFTTLEKMQFERPVVVKNDGRREEYQRDKVLTGIQKACQKRPISTLQMDKMIDAIERAIMELSDQEVSTRDIGNIVMSFLRDLDTVAYVRFASVYRTFKDLDEFIKDLKYEDEKRSHSGSIHS